MLKPGIAAIVLLGLTACAGDGGLRRLGEGQAGPDEFTVLPVLPLTLPETSALPTPTPGGTNRTDRNPAIEAIAALGGRGTGAAGGIPAGEAALVAAASSNGVEAGIRQTVASEDAAFRRNARALGAINFLGRDRYFRAYARQSLDAYVELERFRNLGVAVPSAPPAE